MKSLMKFWMLTITLVSLTGSQLNADTSIILNNDMLAIESMHLQEVVLIVQSEKISEANTSYQILKSVDGVNYLALTEVININPDSPTLVFADHIRAGEITHYQLIAVGNQGAVVLSSVTYDPNLKVSAPQPAIKEPNFFSDKNQTIDPHSL